MTRKTMACLVALLLMAVSGVALAAEYDFSDLSISEMYEMRALLDAAIEEREAAGGAGCYQAGSYQVGTDLPEGDYAVQERENAMFASVVVRAGESDTDPLILHKLVNGQIDIHLEKNTWVTFSEVQAWPLGTEPSDIGQDGSVAPGAYLVGRQLPEGRYQVSPADKAPLSSYSVFSGIVGTREALLRFELVHEATELTLADGEYVELSGATMIPVTTD